MSRLTRRAYPVRSYARHVQRWLKEATPQEFNQGFEWYAKAGAEVEALARKHGLTVDATAGIVAALSPMVRWERNIIEAESVIVDGKGRGVYGANVRKALDILAGGDPDKILGGAKVRAFYALLRDKGENSEVAIDSIAILAALGVSPNPLVSNDDAGFVFNRPKQLAAIRKAYIREARRAGLRPCEAQAIVWVTWRNERDKS